MIYNYNNQKYNQIRMESIVAEPKIHFYQFMSIQILNEYILTGIEYMVKSIMNSNQKLIKFRYYSHEIATIISGIKDIYFLIRHKGIYAQNFYGLERVNQRSKGRIVLQIIVWVILPYLWKKIQAKFNQIKDKQQNGERIGKIAKIYATIFPVLYCIVKIANTVLKFKYLIHKESQYYNLQYYATKTQLGYIEAQEPSPFPIMSFLKSPGLFVLLVAHKIASYIFSSENKQKKKVQAIEIEAPVTEKKSKQCPICGKKAKNPSVLRTSGYVFCYNCIVPEVRSTQKCPVTSIPSNQQQIQIIYQ